MSMAEQSLELDVHEGEGEAADGVSGQATPKSWQEELEEHGETGGERRHGTEDGEAPPCAGGEIAADKGGGEVSVPQDENHVGWLSWALRCCYQATPPSIRVAVQTPSQ